MKTKINKLFSVLLSTVLVLTYLPAVFALEGEPVLISEGFCGKTNNEFGGENVIWQYFDDNTLVISGEGAVGNNTWYEQAPDFSHLVICDGVTDVDGNFFINEYSLKYVFLGRDVLLIGTVFPGCANLEAIEVDEANESYCDLDGVVYNKELTRLVCYPGGKREADYMVPEGVTDFDGSAIGHSLFLVSITLSSTVQNVGSYDSDLADIHVVEANPFFSSKDGVLFNKNFTSLLCYPARKDLSAYSVPDGVERIESQAFYFDGPITYLHNLTLPVSLSYIASDAFYGSTWGRRNVYYEGTMEQWTQLGAADNRILQSSMMHFENDPLWDHILLQNVCAGAEEGSVLTWTFRDDESLTFSGSCAMADYHSNNIPWEFMAGPTVQTVIIEQGVTRIGESAFSNGNNINPAFHLLKTIVIPNSVQSIGERAFEKCESLTDVFYGGSQADWQAITVDWNYNGALRSANIHYNATGHTPGEEVIENEIPATCTEGGSYDEVVYCTGCDYEFSREQKTIDPIAHANAYSVAAADATENVHGYTSGVYCPDCDTWLSGHEVIHNHLGAQTVIKPATEGEEGLVDIVCTVCGETIRYTASTTQQDEDNGGIEGFWTRIVSFFRGIIDWFLRLFRKP